MDRSAPFPVDVLGDIGQQCEVAERADDRDRLVNVDAVEQSRHLGPIDFGAANPERLHPGPLHEREHLVPVLFAHRVAQHRSEQPDVLAHRLGGLPADRGPVDRADRLERAIRGGHIHVPSIGERRPRRPARTGMGP